MKCRVGGCGNHHDDNMVCCKGHWFKLPMEIRDEIWRLYRLVQSGGLASDRKAHADACWAAIDSLDRGLS